jgi:hypothetical protein
MLEYPQRGVAVAQRQISDGTFHFEAGTQVRQVEDRTIDRRPAALKGDACSLESAAAPARFISALLLRVIHCSIPATRAAQARFRVPHYRLAWFSKTRRLGGQPCTKRAQIDGAPRRSSSRLR